ncbi:single-stranded DNA-binding protein [Paraburkholderia atlantica]|uniref:single-stranded DNA-binding protein n=1 Tax=Paraburkholderia atlantica TaxID=2654982 RepID=UPI003D1C436A
MLDALVSGNLTAQAQSRTSGKGRPFVTASLRVPVDGADAVFVRVCCFDPDVGAELLALASGDSVSVTGPLKVGIWQPDNGEPRANIDMIAHAVITPYHVRKRRAAVSAAKQGAAERRTLGSGRSRPMNGAEQAQRMYGNGAPRMDHLPEDRIDDRETGQ